MTAFGKAEGSPVAAAINAAWMLGVCWITCHTVACQWVTRFCFTTVSPHNCLNVWLWKLHKCRFWWVFPHMRFYCSQNSTLQGHFGFSRCWDPDAWPCGGVHRWNVTWWSEQSAEAASEQSNGICWFQRPFWKIRIHPCSIELSCGKGLRRFVDSGSLLHPRFVSQESLRYWLLLLFFWSISQPEPMSHWLLLAPSAKHNKIWWYD